MSSAHSLHAPSGSARRILCAGSLAMEHDLPDVTSDYAAEGTAAHTLASRVLDACGTAACREHVGEVIEADGRQFTVDEEMAEHVQTYVDAVLRCASAPNAQLFVERRLDFSESIGIPGQTGTGDAVVVLPDELQVHDLKFGEGVKVDALAKWYDPFVDELKDGPNSQLGEYALGADDEFGLAFPYTRIRMFIHQPRLNHVSEYSCTVEELRTWGIAIRRSEQLAHANYKEFGEVPQPQRGEALAVALRLTPGEKQCQFCKAKATCPALVKKVHDAVLADFDATSPRPSVSELPSPELLELVEDWARAARAKIESNIFAGIPVYGWKLVEGKRPARAWTDENGAEATLKRMRLKASEIYISKLISPPQAEKLLKKRPRLWAKLSSLISTPSQGRPSVAPESDPRPALVAGTTPDDFDVIGESQS